MLVGSFPPWRGGVMARRSVRVQNSDAKVLEPSDQELVQRFVAGDEFAFNELYNRHCRTLLKLAFQLLKGDEDAAEEITEVCWIKILRSLHTYNGRGSFLGWAGRILQNVRKDQFKKGAYKYCKTYPPDFEFEEWCPAHPSPDPLEQLILKEETDRVMKRLGSLPRPLSQALIMACIEGRSYTEISKILDVQVGAIKMRLHRARLALRETVAG